LEVCEIAMAGLLWSTKDGKLNTDSKTKAEILLEEFKSVFTQEDKSCILTLSGPRTLLYQN